MYRDRIKAIIFLLAMIFLAVSWAPAQAQPDSSPAAAPQAMPNLPQADRDTARQPEEATAAAPAPSDNKSDTRKPVERQLPLSSARSLDEAVNRVIESERRYLENLQKFTPLVETYIQNVKHDSDFGLAPDKDHYFLGRLALTRDGAKHNSYLPRPGFLHRMMKEFSRLYALDFMPLGFAQMVMVDNGEFDRAHYDFKFVRREFLGDTRCIVLDVAPRKGSGNGRFLGRIWVEDQDFNIVRFNGTYSGIPKFSRYLHFDTWRLNLQPGLWLPVYIYSEESDLTYHMDINHIRFKALTRLWGYNLPKTNQGAEFTDVLVEGNQNVQDQSRNAGDLGPVEAQRAWERQSENNALERLQRAGLVAPAGEVDKVLETVVNNLVVTNKLEISPEVRCRIVLTTPLESFHIGHTIVLSRGLIDVLPDEATLAAVLAHELAHIVLGHKTDTKYAYLDRMLFRDEDTYKKMNFRHSEKDEEAADKKALELLQNSPYRDKLQAVGLFTRALDQRRKDLPSLIRGRLGNTLLVSGGHLRLRELENGAPQLQKRDLAQLPALPLGSRIHLDAWSDRLELLKRQAVALQSPTDKLLFEVTPVFPYVTRYRGEATSSASAEK
jgi:hypothetical protein